MDDLFLAIKNKEKTKNQGRCILKLDASKIFVSLFTEITLESLTHYSDLSNKNSMIISNIRK